MIWQNEISEKAALMRQNRLNFISKLALLGSKQDWSHITAQGGFYCQTGLNKEQITVLREDYSVYMPDSGLIKFIDGVGIGLNQKNIDQVAKAFCAVE